MIRPGFTLIELLMAVAIVAALAGMIVGSYPKRDLRQQQVRAAAEELAATMRQARALAIERRSTHAVVFHIQNAPDSNGRVLNNRSGGHWYRILGPQPDTANGGFVTADQTGATPAVVGAQAGSYANRPFTIVEAADLVEQCWADRAHVLAPGRVRFLALTDMDWGDYGTYASGGVKSRTPSTAVSYPRPWFGWYDEASRRLHPWGGFDPAIAGSGFFYQGRSVSFAPLDALPAPVACTNSATRRTAYWAPSQKYSDLAQVAATDAANDQVIYAAGSPRPLINAAWQDASLQFMADGSVRWGGFLPARHAAYLKDGSAGRRGVAERCNGVFAATGWIDQRSEAEGGCFDRDALGWHVTIAPDAADDNDGFPDVQHALDSIMPAYRVRVSPFGDVAVIAVSRSLDTDGASLFPGDEAWWRTGTNLRQRFGQDRLVDGAQLVGGIGIGAALGRPVTAAVTVEMLATRSVWLE